MKRALFLAATLALTTGGAALAFPPKPAETKAAKPAKAQTPIACPVMKEKVTDPAKAAFSVYKGKKYFFCCPGCKPDFEKNPAKYVKAEPAKPVKPAKNAKKKA